MAFKIRHVFGTGQSLYAYLRKVESGAESDIWDDTNEVWDTGGTLPLTNDNERIVLTAGTGVEQTIYNGQSSADLDSYGGKVSVSIVDLGSGQVAAQYDVEVINGLEVTASVVTPAVTLIDGAEVNKAQTITLDVRAYVSQQAGTGSVISTQIAVVSSTPSFVSTTNAATYSGSPGIYQVSLTAQETNVITPILIRVTTSDGAGEAVITFGTRTIEDDWASGGQHDLQLDTVEGKIDTVDTVVDLIGTIVSALPSAATIADAVLDEASADHVTAGSVGERLERLDIFGTGGAGQLTPALAGNLANLDAAISTRPDAAAVNAEVDQALQDIHLDHLLAANYDPALKPGVGTALLNELIENDGGVSRFSANALEQAPSGVGASLSAIADAVWDEPEAGHVAAGSVGARLNKLVAIEADTNEVQLSLASGGAIHTLITTVDTVVDNTNGQVTNLTIAVAALPSGAQIADAVWDEAVSGHIGAGSTGERIERLDIFAAGGAGQLTGALAANLSNLDVAISTRPDAAAVRAEIDANSTQLAAIVGDTNELQANWESPAGTLFVKLDSISSGADPVAIRQEIDNNSTQLAAIVADTDEVQQSLADGGFTDLLIDAIKADTAAILVDTNFIQITLDTGGAVHTLISNIQPNPNQLSPEFIAPARKWRLPREGDTADNIITVSQGDIVTISMDYEKQLNPDTGIGTPQGWTIVEGDQDLSFTTPVPNQNLQEVHSKVSGALSGKTYKVKVTTTTTDGDTISGHGYIQVN